MRTDTVYGTGLGAGCVSARASGRQRRSRRDQCDMSTSADPMVVAGFGYVSCRVRGTTKHSRTAVLHCAAGAKTVDTKGATEAQVSYAVGSISSLEHRRMVSNLPSRLRNLDVAQELIRGCDVMRRYSPHSVHAANGLAEPLCERSTDK